MSYKFAYVIFLFCSNVGPPYLLYNINQGPTENTFAYCRIYTKHRGHFLRTAKTVSCFSHTNTILCKHSYYLSVLNR